MGNNFMLSKNVLGIIEFDKTNQLWRTCDDRECVYDYKSVKKVNIVDAIQNNKKTSTILSNIATTIVAPTSYAQPSAPVIVQVKVLLDNGEEVYINISDSKVKQNTMDYHTLRKNAEEIKQKFKIIIKRNDTI